MSNNPVSSNHPQDAHRLYVIGMGRDGVAGLSEAARSHLAAVDCIAGYPNHLEQVRHLPGDRIELNSNMADWVAVVGQELQQRSLALLASGDPLYFGIGRLLTEAFSPRQLVFIPHVSSVQLAFNRLQIPWQSATVVSVHGRSLDPLQRSLRQCQTPIAVLTDGIHTPSAIAQLIQDLGLPVTYRLHVCSCLGGNDEAIATCSISDAIGQSFAMPNVVILEQVQSQPTLEQLPLLGLADGDFYTFADQPGLLTKREIRVLAIALLQLPPANTAPVIWDIGAGTGSVSIEMARLLPNAQIFAIEKTSAGTVLIQRNCDRFQCRNITVIHQTAPNGLMALPQPDRIFIGGGGAALGEILSVCGDRLCTGGTLVASFATLESCAIAQAALQDWSVQWLNANIARSTTLQTRHPDTPNATRFVPLNPVTLLQATK